MLTIPEIKRLGKVLEKRYEMPESVARDFVKNFPGCIPLIQNRRYKNLDDFVKSTLPDPETERPEIILQGPEAVSDFGADADGLPDGLPEEISRYVNEFCNRFNIDDMRKGTAQNWGACCIYIGENLKKSGVLRDKEREKTEGGKIYNPERLKALLTLWTMLCGGYDKAPLAGDFISFSGVSSTYFYNQNGHCPLTSAGGELYKTLLEIQERGLSGVLVDGRRNPTGTIFFLKNWHGWKDSREIVHTDGGTATGAEALPVFDTGAGLLEDNGGGK